MSDDSPATPQGASVADDQLAAGLWLPALGMLAAFMLAGAFTRQPHDLVASVVGIAVALGFASLIRADRRLTPLWIAASAVGVVLNAGGGHGTVGWFGICVLALIAVPCAGTRVGALVCVALSGLIAYKTLDHGLDTGWTPWFGGVLLSGIGGWLVARERSLMSQLRAAQAGLAERSRTEERARIARDLHDVIAHSLTVSLLHISAARLAVEHEPAEAARSLAEAERLGRESLDEVRSIVGLMRHGGGDDPQFAPTPGIDGIADLVERFRSAGVDISLERGPEINGNVSATAGTTAYRITQEALTNAAKHAPGAAVAVRIRAVDKDWLELCVDSAGRPGQGSGNGLASMRERAEAIGGRFSAAPEQLGTGAGWRVQAELPAGSGRWRS